MTAMKLILSAITFLFLWGCKPSKKVDNSQTNAVKTTYLKIEYAYINFANNRLVLEKYNIYDTDTAKTNKSGYKYKTVKQNILYSNSGLKKSAFKRSNFKVLLTLNHSDSNYLANIYSTDGICPIKYYNNFYILVKTPDNNLKLPYGNQLYYFDTLNISLTKLKYNQLLKEPATYSPGEVTMYNYSDLAEYHFYISKSKMEFTIGKSLAKN